jgi:hypothetical protein
MPMTRPALTRRGFFVAISSGVRERHGSAENEDGRTAGVESNDAA